MAKTVLIVDDVAFVRKTLAELLGQIGFDVVGEALDGMEAIEKYRALRPDVVTMDIVMPKLSGIEATRQICKMDKNACVVMVSAMDQMNLIMEAINAGARDYLQKPFQSAEIARVIERAMRGEGPAAATRSHAVDVG